MRSASETDESAGSIVFSQEEANLKEINMTFNFFAPFPKTIAVQNFMIHAGARTI
jgi:hypothetical protein